MEDRRFGAPPLCVARKIPYFLSIHRGGTVQYKEASARGIITPPPKPRAGFSARYPSKEVEHPQPRNFAEILFNALRCIGTRIRAGRFFRPSHDLLDDLVGAHHIVVLVLEDVAVEGISEPSGRVSQ